MSCRLAFITADPCRPSAELADGTLTLHLNKAPAYPMFNKPDIAEKFHLAMQTLTGQNVHVVMQPMDTAADQAAADRGTGTLPERNDR